MDGAVYEAVRKAWLEDWPAMEILNAAQAAKPTVTAAEATDTLAQVVYDWTREAEAKVGKRRRVVDESLLTALRATARGKDIDAVAAEVQQAHPDIPSEQFTMLMDVLTHDPACQLCSIIEFHGAQSHLKVGETP